MSRLGDTRTFREIIEYNGIKLGIQCIYLMNTTLCV